MQYAEWGNVFCEPELLAVIKADPMVHGIRASAGHFYIALDTPLEGRNTTWVEDNLADVLGMNVKLCAVTSTMYQRAVHAFYTRPS